MGKIIFKHTDTPLHYVPGYNELSLTLLQTIAQIKGPYLYSLVTRVKSLWEFGEIYAILYKYNHMQTRGTNMETERLLIRRFNPDDWQDLFENLSQEAVVEYEPYEVFSEEASKQEAVRRSEDKNFWAVCLKDNGKLIGNIYLSKQDFDTWELGYVFNENYHKK